MQILDLGNRRKYLRALQGIKVFKNFLRPVNKFPSETLSKVLEHRANERDLVAATHVCRYWRSSLVSSPALWSCLHSHYDRDRMRTYLKRSKSLPVDIEIELRVNTSSELFEPIASLVGRARSLTIHGPVGLVRKVLHVFRYPAPSLRRLKIKCGLNDREYLAICLLFNFLD